MQTCSHNSLNGYQCTSHVTSLAWIAMHCVCLHIPVFQRISEGMAWHKDIYRQVQRPTSSRQCALCTVCDEIAMYTGMGVFVILSKVHRHAAADAYSCKNRIQVPIAAFSGREVDEHAIKNVTNTLARSFKSIFTY